MDIKKCVSSTSEGWTIIQFGDKQEGEICWEVSSNGGILTNEDKFTELFKKNWNIGTKTWSDNSKQGDSWKTVCGGSSGWTIVTESGNNEEYVGTCDWATGKTESFLKKTTEKTTPQEKVSIKLSACQGDCLTNQSQTGSFKQLGRPEQGNWFPITFKAKN